MCCGCGGGPPYGIPIEADTQALYSDELNAAWNKFDAWWQKALQENSDFEPIDRKLMPEDVKAAMELIKETPIPGFEGFTGADSCYIIGVEMQMTEPE